MSYYIEDIYNRIKLHMVKFEIYKDNRKEFRFRLKAKNGQMLMEYRIALIKRNVLKTILLDKS